MPKFRKKPVVIEARQFVSNNGPIEHMDELIAWMNASGHPDRYPRLTDETPVASHDHTNIFISTLEGEICASVGDWIIKGVKGEFYPCKPDIFEQTYEPAE